MAYRMLTDLPAALRQSGYPVVVVDGYANRGRPASTGSFSPRGQVAHHTGAHGTRTRAQELAYVKRVLVPGFSHLPGPLCQTALGRETKDGPPVWYVVAAGRANHAGRARSRGFMRAGDGNAQAIGTEAINSGFEGWSDRELDAYHCGMASIADHYRWPRGNVLLHAESSTAGKWDPGLNWKPINATTFRRDIARASLGGDMPLTNKEIEKIADVTARKLLVYPLEGRDGAPKEAFSDRLRAIRVNTSLTQRSIRSGVEGHYHDGETYNLLKRIARKLEA